ERDHAHRPSAVGVYQLIDDPAVSSDPAPARAIEEQCPCDRKIESSRDEHGSQTHEQDNRQPGMIQPDLYIRATIQGCSGHQKERRGPTMKCTPAMARPRSSGNARSIGSTVPRPDRTLPRRSPTPTSSSTPSGSPAYASRPQV